MGKHDLFLCTDAKYLFMKLAWDGQSLETLTWIDVEKIYIVVS